MNKGAAIVAVLAALWWLRGPSPPAMATERLPVDWWINKNTGEIIYALGVLPPDGREQNLSAWRPASESELFAYQGGGL